MDFCAQHNIVPMVKLIKADQLDDVYAALEKKNDGVIRYVLDVAASS
jgi:D-arabinose 1-dehydrogenase-like Zn-dependent alcohol dehydrogenase